MYEFMTNFATVCKDIGIPIMVLFCLIALMFYLNRRSQYYRTMSTVVFNLAKYIESEAKKTDAEILKFQNIKEGLSK